MEQVGATVTIITLEDINQRVAITHDFKDLNIYHVKDRNIMLQSEILILEGENGEQKILKNRFL